MNALTVEEKEVRQSLVIYEEMVSAIDKCYRIDQCKEIANRSFGFSAYWKQANDTEVERKFIIVRMRAWRRMGEILIDCAQGLKDEEYQHRGVKKMGVSVRRFAAHLRTVIPQLADMTDNKISELARMARVPAKDFEEIMNNPSLTGSIGDFFRNTPEAKRRMEEEKAFWETQSPERDARVAEINQRHDARAVEYDEIIQSQNNFEEDLEQSGEEALEAATGTVGMTFKRYDRETQRQFTVIMRKEHHDLLHKIRYEQRITMWEVLRRGLKMYAEQHGYEFPVFDEEGQQMEET